MKRYDIRREGSRLVKHYCYNGLHVDADKAEKKIAALEEIDSKWRELYFYRLEDETKESQVAAEFHKLLEDHGKEFKS